MPFYEYEARDLSLACAHCRNPFSVLQSLRDAPLQTCPQCQGPVVRVISAPNVGASRSGFDDRAKKAGFSKLKRLGKGEYEKQY